jgi:hypothetical protein
LAFDGAPKTLELLGMGIAPSAHAKLFAFLVKGLLELNASPFGSFHQLAPVNIQLTAIGCMGYCLFLDRGVNDETLKFAFFTAQMSRAALLVALKISSKQASPKAVMKRPT